MLFIKTTNSHGLLVLSFFVKELKFTLMDKSISFIVLLM